MARLRIADNLALPLETVTQKLAWIGTTGSGKTYGASKLAEQMWYADAQFVALDVVGVWYGLRLRKDGKPSKITVPVFGGLHGDIPLEPTAGALIADLIVDRTLSCVLDLSQFESDADKARFALAFADRFFFRKKAAPSAVHLFLEECQELVPQNPQKGEERMLHAFTRMQKLGRNFGIGSSLISQRPQEVNKKALNMAQTLFVFRTTGTHERKAIEAWIQDKALDQDIAGDLPKLATGTCHVWSPEFLKISETAQILPKDTFDASATPEVGEGSVTRELAPIDLKQLANAMSATIEKAKAEDPKELRKQIAERDKRIKALENNAGGISAQEALEHDEFVRMTEAKFVELRTEAQNAQVENQRLRNLLDVAASELYGWWEKLSQGIGSIPKSAAPTPPRAMPKSRPAQSTQAPPMPKPAPARSTNGSIPTASIPKGERITLISVAQHGSVERDQLTVLTGYKRSSRDAYVQRLKEKGYVEVNGREITATSAGIDALGNDYEPLPTGDALLQYWLQRLGEGERRVLEFLAARHPAAADRTEIDEATGYKRSSRDAYIQRLKSRRLVATGFDGVRANDNLF